MEHGLVRDARKAGNALGHEILHALRDEGLLKKRGAVSLGMNQFIELFDLVAELYGQRIGLKFAGVANCFHADLLKCAEHFWDFCIVCPFFG
jgi:hypothetical protein